MSRELKNSYLFKNISVLDCKVILLKDKGQLGSFFFPNISEACCIGLTWPSFGRRGQQEWLL